jgi:hypothetical protein
MNSAQAPPELKLVPLYDRFDPVHGPCFDPDHPHIDDAAERERVAAFLRDGAIVLRSAAFESDAATHRGAG